ncbi:MAG TPA: SurA N-terminal domain-containing protein [Polyangiaceae bacterium]|jgi:peptidyl-prolyl cis-trans isomerase D|nr:SurA N-terminal domain-containing protein [Polyangiaceae bacterium]
MLNALRQGGTGQALMATVVMAIIVVFILEFRSTSRMQTGSIRRECAATVGRECVTRKDFYAEYGLVVPRGMPQKQVKTYQLRRQVLDGIVERELLVQEANRLGLGVDEEAVKEELRLGHAHASLPAASSLRLGVMLDLVSGDEHGIARDMVRELPVINQKTQEVDDELFGRVVRSMTNRSPKEFMKMQARELLAARMRELVKSRVRVSEDEAFDAYEREKSKAVVRFVKIESDWAARYLTDPSDAAVDKWAEGNKPQVDEAWKAESSKWKPDCLLVSEISATSTEDATEADKTLLKDKMDRAKGELDKGASFDAVARELSDGPTALTGGHLGCVTAESYGEGGDVIVKTAEALAPGAVSDLVSIKRGYRIVKSEGKLAAGDVETLGRRFVSRPLALRAQAEARAHDLATKLVTAVQSGARLDDTLTKVLPEFVLSTAPAKKKTATVKADADKAEPPALIDPRAPKMEVSAPFPIDGDPVPGAYGVPVGKMAFELAKPDDVRVEPIPVAGGLVVLQLKEKTVATREDFSKEKIELMRRIEVAKRSESLAHYVARLRKAKEDKIELSERILEEPKTSDGE